jgi:hypothetical protein
MLYVLCICMLLSIVAIVLYVALAMSTTTTTRNVIDHHIVDPSSLSSNQHQQHQHHYPLPPPHPLHHAISSPNVGGVGGSTPTTSRSLLSDDYNEHSAFGNSNGNISNTSNNNSINSGSGSGSGYIANAAITAAMRWSRHRSNSIPHHTNTNITNTNANTNTNGDESIHANDSNTSDTNANGVNSVNGSDDSDTSGTGDQVQQPQHGVVVEEDRPPYLRDRSRSGSISGYPSTNSSFPLASPTLTIRVPSHIPLTISPGKFFLVMPHATDMPCISLPSLHSFFLSSYILCGPSLHQIIIATIG